MFGAAAMFSRWSIVFCWVSFVSFIIPHTAGAGIGEWKNYTNMKSVRAVATDGATIWTATSGGVFRFNPADSSYQKFTNTEGLTTNDVTSIFIDQSGRVWMGQFSGSIDVYDPKNQTWMYITDIALSAKVDKSIRGLYSKGDKLYIATAFGITVFSMSKFEFVDTYTNFATASQPAVNAVTVFQNNVVAATNRGIVISKSNAINLAAPESWDITSAITTGNSFLEFNGELYAGTLNGLLKFQNNSWVNAFGIGGATRLITTTDTSLLLYEFVSLKSVTSTGGISNIAASYNDSAVGGVIMNDKKIFLGFHSSGIGTVQSTQQGWDIYAPNGPHSNLFYQIAVDNNGAVWGVSGRSNGKGFYSFDGTQWKNYNLANNPLVLSDDCFAISIGPNNSKWIGTWGEGLLLVDGQGTVVRRFDYDYPGFIGVLREFTSIPSYTVPGAVAVDKSGSVWVTVYQSLDNNKVLWRMKPDSTWESFPGSQFGYSSSFMHSIMIDNNNTKWFTNAVVGRAVGSVPIVFHNNSIPNTTNGWGTITESDGASNSVVYSIVADRSGDLWLGTGNGVTIITNPNNPSNRVTKVFLGAVRDLSINCLAVDPLNNKWVGTSRGVFVLSPDGTQLLQQYNVENTNGKLVDNNILSIAFNNKKGIAYFGTEKGLSSLAIAAVAAQPAFSTIELSPNPVYLPDHSVVEIRGLVDESTVKVLSLNGKVVKQFAAQGGGRAFWDCRDGEGRRVASGIYIVAAYDRTGTQVASSKVAVIQK